jgi:hypothetical protein
MADRFDVVAVRVQNEGSIIVGVVLWPQSGSAVVPAAGAQRRLVERLDFPTSIGTEGDVYPRRVRLPINPSNLRNRSFAPS